MIDGMITVRSKSTRLPEKCFLPFGDGNVIEHVIRRAKHFNINPIVCTTVEESDDRIVEIAKKEGVRFYRGSEKDKLVRWRDSCREHGVEKFVSIDADDPFFDGDLSYKSFNTLNDNLDIVKHPIQQPNNGFYEGCVGYSLTYDIVEKTCELKNTDDTEMMWNFIDKVPSVKVGYLQVDNDKIDFPIRLTLDYQEDYWLMNSLVRILGQNPNREKIINFFMLNPDLYKINWFRNDDYKLAQHNTIK